MNIEKICHAFQIEGVMTACETIKSGNINDTFKVTFRHDGYERLYIVQQINTYVFKEPMRMMENISRVTTHIANKLTEDDGRSVLHFLKTKNGKSCFFDDAGKCWRAYCFIDDSVTYDTCDNLEVLEQTGVAFGRFQVMLSDFDATALTETIADFHDTEKRFESLFRHAEEDAYHRAAETAEELAFFKEHHGDAVRLTVMQKNGMLPVRVTHNDTKCNNVLFDIETHRALTVIDLDTVMPGLALHDYGDAVRFSANSAEEDEPDITKVSLDIEKFRAFTRGFIAQVGSVLEKNERENLVHGIFVITMELASRFLDDYLTGDKYFKTDYPGHNLVRTRSQLALARDILAKYVEMNDIMDEIFRESKLKNLVC